MIDPCAPAVHSRATLRAWAGFRRAHPNWHPPIPDCTRAAALAVPLALGPSGFVPGSGGPIPALPPVLPAPPAWHEGQDFFETGAAPWVLAEFSSPVLGAVLPVASAVPPIGSENSPVPPAVQVPEPASWMLAAVGAGAAALVKRRRA